MKKILLSSFAFLTLILSTSVYATSGHGHKWWSDRYNKWFDKRGDCSQYNHTDYDTCNSGKDDMQCDWDSHRNKCYFSSHDSHESKWWSERYKRWFEKTAHCKQYDHTDYETCNSPKDTMLCVWDHAHHNCSFEHR